MFFGPHCRFGDLCFGLFCWVDFLLSRLDQSSGDTVADAAAMFGVSLFCLGQKEYDCRDFCSVLHRLSFDLRCGEFYRVILKKLY